MQTVLLARALNATALSALYWLRPPIAELEIDCRVIPADIGDCVIVHRIAVGDHALEVTIISTREDVAARLSETQFPGGPGNVVHYLVHDVRCQYAGRWRVELERFESDVELN